MTYRLFYRILMANLTEFQKEGYVLAIKRIKDKTNLMGSWKVHSNKKHYYEVFLWADQKSFDENTMGNNPGESSGCCNHAPTKLLLNEDNSVFKKIPPIKMGEVHFIKGKWDMEVVAHELCHAMIGRFRNLPPKLCDIVMQNGDAEETLCYEFGKWVDITYRKLWKADPR